MQGRTMSEIQSTPPLCPKCHKAMRSMLVKELGGRKLQCTDCDQPDPMRSADTQAWLNGELGSKS
jgi:hypothetical protein